MVLRLYKNTLLYGNITLENLMDQLARMETNENKRLYREKSEDLTYSAHEVANTLCQLGIESSNISVAAVISLLVYCLYEQCKLSEVIKGMIEIKTIRGLQVKIETVEDLINLILEESLEKMREVTEEYLNKNFPDQTVSEIVSRMDKYSVERIKSMMI